MKKEQTAIVVGAGIGGIATAARLARHGFQVTVIEKNDRPGGRCDQIVRDGHRFDTGPTLFLMPEVFEETYRAMGEEMNEALDLKRIDPTYRIYFEDGTHMALTADLNEMQQQLESIEPGSFGGYLRYMAEGHTNYRLSLEKFVGRNFNNIFDYFSLRNLPLIFKLKALTKHYDNIGNYFDDPRLKAAFTFQNMYLGLSPYDAPATFSLLQYTELADGIWFPMGGMYEVIQSLEGVAKKLGVKFVYEAPIEKILVENDKASGVMTEDGRTWKADIVIANADLPYVYSNLLPDKKAAQRIDNKKYTCSSIMFYWGVDKQYPELGHHNVFLANDYKASFDEIFEDHSLPSKPSFYVNVANRTDASAAPDGQDSLMVLVPVGHLDSKTKQEWDALTDRARDAVLQRLHRELDITDLREHIKFEVSYTPVDWQRMYNLAKGSAFGLSHNFMQVGYLRPKNRHPKVKNLYFTGASTHPGTGLPMVLLSARLTSERILADYDVPQEMSQPELATAVA